MVHNISFRCTMLHFLTCGLYPALTTPKFTFLPFLFAEYWWDGGRFTCIQGLLCAGGFTCIFSFNSPSTGPACACKGTS